MGKFRTQSNIYLMLHVNVTNMLIYPLLFIVPSPTNIIYTWKLFCLGNNVKHPYLTLMDSLKLLLVFCINQSKCKIKSDCIKMTFGGCFGRKQINLSHTFLCSAAWKFQTLAAVVIGFSLLTWSVILRKQKQHHLHTPYSAHTLTLMVLAPVFKRSEGKMKKHLLFWGVLAIFVKAVFVTGMWYFENKPR